jgi:hypothetical protein
LHLQTAAQPALLSSSLTFLRPALYAEDMPTYTHNLESQFLATNLFIYVWVYACI